MEINRGSQGIEVKKFWLGVCVGVIGVFSFLYTIWGYVNVSEIKLFSDISGASAFLAQVFGVMGLGWMLVCSFISADSSRIKLIGSGLVLSLAFAANNVWTYALSIFIVATLVTELQFLEKLAAMFTNRDKYWDYLAQKSTPEQAQQKAAFEAVQEATAEEAEQSRSAEKGAEENGLGDSVVLPVNPDSAPSEAQLLEPDPLSIPSEPETSNIRRASSSLAVRTKNILEFHSAAVDALKDYTSLLTGSTILPDMRFTAPGVKFEVDALLKTESIDYVVEIKRAVTFAGLGAGLAAVQRNALLYSNLISSAGERKSVKGMLIVPQGAWVKNRFGSTGVLVLELDEVQRKLKHVEGDWY